MKKRWKNLKDQYRKELKKLPAPRSGDPGDHVQSTWQFFSQMNFLRFEILPNNSDTNLRMNNDNSQLSNTMSLPLSSPHTETDSQESVIKETDVHSPIDTVNIQQPSTCDDEIRLITTIETPTNPPLLMNTSASTPRPQKRKTANDIRTEMLELEKKRLLLLEKDLQQNSGAIQSSENTRKSEDYYYLMSLLPQMESFNPLQRYHVRNRVNQIMMEEIQNSMYGEPYRGNTSTSWSHGYTTRTPE